MARKQPGDRVAYYVVDAGQPFEGWLEHRVTAGALIARGFAPPNHAPRTWSIWRSRGMKPVMSSDTIDELLTFLRRGEGDALNRLTDARAMGQVLKAVRDGRLTPTRR